MSREQHTPAQATLVNDSDEPDTDENAELDELVTQALPVVPRSVFETPYGQAAAHEVNSEDVTLDEDEAPTSRRR